MRSLDMAWGTIEDQVFSDRWRVSSLAWAFVELILGFVVLLCAIISVATTKLLRASGLCASCPSCEGGCGMRHRAPRNQRKQSQVAGCKPLQSVADCPVDVDMDYVCEECVLNVASCSTSQNCVGGETSASEFHSNLHPKACRASVAKSGIRQRSRQDALKEADSLFFSVAADSHDERDAFLFAAKTSEPITRECRLCKRVISTDARCLSELSRKRKFPKVFPGESRDGSPRECVSEFQNVGKSVSGSFGRDEDVVSRYVSQDEIVLDEEFAVGEQLISLPQQILTSDQVSSRLTSWEGSSANSSRDSFTLIQPFSFEIEQNVLVADRKSREKMSTTDFQLGVVVNTDLSIEGTGSFEAVYPSDVVENENCVLEPEDDSLQSETSGVTDLKEVVRAERKALRELYDELEKERSASATAANEAMAMISRLQEEKAAALMECRQYQRMAEEKQLYDQEAIAVLQDILVSRDEQVFKLEEETRLYRQKLLSLSIDELGRAESETSEVATDRKSDFLLIERETLLLDGAEMVKNSETASREERLLAEIKEWVTGANNSVATASPPDSGGELNFSGKDIGTSLVSGRKNLLGSFSSVEGQGKVPAEVASKGGNSNRTLLRKDGESAAAGYESFHNMMDSLRNEPNLRDEASLETLDKIEEKFEKQSRKGKIRNEDDLRRIWKSTLRSLSPTDGLPVKQATTRDPDEEADCSGLKSGIVRDTAANRAMEQKKISVLEYVWKFEEQLHHAAGKKKKNSSQPNRTVSADVINLSSTGPETDREGQTMIRGGSVDVSSIGLGLEKHKTSPGDGARLPPSRFRKHGSEGEEYYVRADFDGQSSQGSQARKSESSLIHEDEECNEGSLVHDVYEVQQDTLASSKSNTQSVDVKNKMLSAFKNHVNEQSSRSLGSDLYMEFFSDNGDRLGKPDSSPGHSYVFQNERSGSRVSSPEDKHLDQDIERPESYVSGQNCDPALTKTSQIQSSVSKMDDNVVNELTTRLKILEADRERMQQAISSLRLESGEMQVLRDIAQHVKETQGSGSRVNASEVQNSSLVPSLKGMLSFSRLRCTVQAQLNKLVHLFLKSVELGVCHGDQHVGLCRFLQVFLQRPSPVTRAAEAIFQDILLARQQENVSQPESARSIDLLSQHSWPLNYRDRSGTALGGWDY